MTKIELAQRIYQKNNPDSFGIDPLILATIVSIIIQIIRLIYDYNHPKQLYDDVNKPGLFRGVWLRYRIGFIIFQSGSNLECGKFLEAFRTCLKGKSEQELQNLIGDCT